MKDNVIVNYAFLIVHTNDVVSGAEHTKLFCIRNNRHVINVLSSII